ncbi:TPA: hypothetical protein IAC10_09830 [Candidatus Scatousia excrementigallinarum]|uniref:Uncharacterized protein n=1 Tax=Candidatus Scatousia excrementigallinarum TaxID=2840935 RepID=A0A9D1EZW8_9BACT|nr:hypothetical protein [Candidatus Scatousia excrementigallinarum]
MTDHTDPLKSMGLYSTEYSTDDYVSTIEDTGAQPRKIEPREYKKENIFRIYISNTSINGALLNELKETILEHGDSITEFLGGKFDDEALSQIAGRIDTADFVVLLYNNEQKIENISGLQCVNCSLGDVCKNKHSGNCQCYLSEYEYNYSIFKQKPVLVILDDKNARRGRDFFSRYEKVEKSEIIFCRDNEIERIKHCYQQFYANNNKSLKGLSRDRNNDAAPKGHGDKLLRVLNKCVQRGGVSQTIGEYVITSGEMSARAGSEIHIITNELNNYDFTTMSSLTIAMNTQRGAKYYYYCTEDQYQVIGKLKERIKLFYGKTFWTRQEVVAWIRQAKFKKSYFEEWIAQIQDPNNKKLGDIIEYLLTRSGLDRYIDAVSLECKKICDEHQVDYEAYLPNLNTEILYSWLSSKINDLNRDYKTVYRFIDALSVLIKPLKIIREVKRHRVVADFVERLDALNNMSKLTRWQLSPEGWEITLSRSEVVSLMTYFQYSGNSQAGSNRKLIVSEQIRDWLISAEGELLGNVDVSEEQKNEWVENVHFCKIKDGVPYILGYNFTLFLDHIPNQTDMLSADDTSAAAAWYTTYNRNDNSAPVAIDNSMLMINIGSNDELFPEIQDIYKNIIEHNNDTLDELRNGQSIILNRLGIVD